VSSSSERVVHAADLRFAYRRSGFSLHVPELAVHAGERVGLIGPSGCGKSTVLGLISGLLAGSSGSLVVAGRELVGLSEGARRRHRLTSLGLVFQDYPLVEHLDATGNVLLPYRIGGLRLTSQVKERAHALLTELGLGRKTGRRPARLSQGERQRVALARALVTEPALIQADEPTTGLDPARTQAVVDLLSRVCAERGVTLLLVTHEQAVVERLDRAIDVSDWATEATA